MKLVIILAAIALWAQNPAIQNMQPNTWYEVPNSKMKAVCPTEAQYPGICGICCCCDGVIRLWSGGAFDSKRNRLIVWGGGHRGYYGNELYVFDLDDFKWTRVTNPSTPNDPDICARVLLGGTPVARHTYYAVDYFSSTDRFFCAPIAGTACLTGMYDELTWTFDFDTANWNGPQYGWKPMMPAGEDPPHGVSMAGAYDPVSDKFYYTGTSSSEGWGGFWVYDVQANQWDQKSQNQSAYKGDQGAAVDTKRGIFIVIGNGKVVATDIRNWTYISQVWSTSGGSGAVNGRPGVNYDPVADRIVAWDGGSVYALNMDTKSWESKASAPQSAASNGTYGRFRYSPKENAYVAVNDVEKNVLIYKMTAGAGMDPNKERAGNGRNDIFINTEPNPFSTRVAIHYRIKTEGHGRSKLNLKVFDILGKCVMNFTDRVLPSSNVIQNSLIWHPSSLRSGLYILKASTGNKTVSKLLFLQK